MKRRDLLKHTAAAGAVLAAPSVARAQNARVLRFAPLSSLAPLDPVGTGSRPTHVHGNMIFDTLYGLDEFLVPQPQMVEGHTVDGDLVWTIRLRDGLTFHDGAPVLARDAVASIRRFAARDSLSQALMADTDELSAMDDRTFRFRLRKPFRHLPAALAGTGPTMTAVMPERLARTDPFTQVTEMVGSGPYRFVAAEFNAGARSAYERYTAYRPRPEGRQSYTAGPKVAHFDRVEWSSLGDEVTAVAALMRGEIDWVESPSADQVQLLKRRPDITVEVREPTGSIAIMRFNQLHPPFDNPAVRRALLGAVEQSDVMSAVAGTDPAYWRDRIGVFPPGSPLLNEVGIDAITAPRDYARVKRDLAAAGYRGEPITVLTVSGNGYIAPISLVGADELRKSGMVLDLQVMDFPTFVRRRASKESPDKGGWNVFFNILDGLFSANPASITALRGDGKSGMEGWSNSPALEALRTAWLEAPDLATEKRIGLQVQEQLWADVPYIPMGHWVRSTAHRRDIVDLPWGFASFYGVRRA